MKRWGVEALGGGTVVESSRASVDLSRTYGSKRSPRAAVDGGPARIAVATPSRRYEKNPVTLKTIKEKALEYTQRAETLKEGLNGGGKLLETHRFNVKDRRHRTLATSSGLRIEAPV